MLPESSVLLKDILKAIDDAEEHTVGFDATMFDEVLVVQQAVLWNLAIIGEAMTRLRKLEPATAERITEWDRIIKMRNQLIHGYDSIRVKIVWDVVQTKLPILRREVTALLAEGQKHLS